MARNDDYYKAHAKQREEFANRVRNRQNSVIGKIGNEASYFVPLVSEAKMGADAAIQANRGNYADVVTLAALGLIPGGKWIKRGGKWVKRLGKDIIDGGNSRVRNTMTREYMENTHRANLKKPNEGVVNTNLTPQRNSIDWRTRGPITNNKGKNFISNKQGRQIYRNTGIPAENAYLYGVPLAGVGVAGGLGYAQYNINNNRIKQNNINNNSDEFNYPGTMLPEVTITAKRNTPKTQQEQSKQYTSINQNTSTTSQTTPADTSTAATNESKTYTPINETPSTVTLSRPSKSGGDANVRAMQRQLADAGYYDKDFSRRGDSEAVKSLQQQLIDMGYLDNSNGREVDGKYGAKTRAAYIKYLRDKEVDGKMGARTSKALTRYQQDNINQMQPIQQEERPVWAVDGSYYKI